MSSKEVVSGMGWRPKIGNIHDVPEYQLCSGCGACAYISPDEVQLVDAVDYGRHPILRDGEPKDARTAEAMQVCPGVALVHVFDLNDPALIRELAVAWGPVYEVWEGHAADPKLRFAGSSGGAVSALALFCIEELGFHGVLHTAARPDAPYLNHTVMSTTREGILARTGSRYSPASPCDGLQMIEDAPAPCVFVGKPCDVAAAQMARAIRSGLDRRIGLTLACFCGGTPSTKGTLKLFEALGVCREEITDLRYRGCGWPGMTGVTLKDKGGRVEMPYQQAWDTILTKHKPFRCHICPDGTGEFADIACGDPWYRTAREGEEGRSLIVVRTELGRRIVRGAIDAGFLVAERCGPDILPRSQPGLLNRRRHVFPKAVAMSLAGLPFPRFQGFSLVRGWLRLSARRMLVSLFRAFRYAWSLKRKDRQPLGESDSAKTEPLKNHVSMRAN